jgi:hypothetical protein
LCRGRANNHRPATQLRVIPLFHGSEKRIHVQMEDHTKHFGGRLPHTLKSQKPHVFIHVAWRGCRLSSINEKLVRKILVLKITF